MKLFLDTLAICLHLIKFELYTNLFVNLDKKPVNFRKNSFCFSVKKWDSLKHMELIVALENEFKIKFDTHEIPTMINFKIIFATISSHIESK